MAATVLVVEDEQKLRELVRSHQERAGFAVLSTGSGTEATTMAADASPDPVVLDLGEVTVRGAAAELTPTEWGILVALATVPGRVYSRYELINRLRGYEFAGYERTVDSHVKNLRRKIGDDPSDPRIVQIALDGGYRLGLARDE